jgi:hypothetical protein
MELTVSMFFCAGKAGEIIRNECIAFTKKKDLIFAAKDPVEAKWQPTEWKDRRMLTYTNAGQWILWQISYSTAGNSECLL